MVVPINLREAIVNMKKILLSALLLCSFSPVHAVLLHTESFEEAPGAAYTLNTAFDDGFFDYFDRYAVPDNGNVARDDYQIGWDGSFGIQAQDIWGDGGPPTGSIGINGIGVAGFTDLQVTVSLGALDSEPVFSNFEISQGDGIEIIVSLDGGADTIIGKFSPPDPSGDLYLDSDFNGIGDGERLTTVLTDFTFFIPSGGSILDLRVELTSTGSFESLAVDNIRVEGLIAPVPEPTTLTLMGLGLAGIGYRRQRNKKAA